MENIPVKGRQLVEINKDASVRVTDGSEAIVVIRPEKNCCVKVKIKTGKNCRVESYFIQQTGTSVIQANRVGKSSIMHTFSLWFSEGQGEVLNILEGPYAEAYDLHVFVVGGSDRLHLNSALRHSEKGTKGDILMKGIARDAASAMLSGIIKVGKSGAGAESFISQHAMLMNAGAHADAKPELEIENNDVSSRHSASVSQIDEKKVFYLMTRGLSRDRARKLIVEGFLKSAIDRIQNKWMQKNFLEKVAAAL